MYTYTGAQASSRVGEREDLARRGIDRARLARSVRNPLAYTYMYTYIYVYPYIIHLYTGSCVRAGDFSPSPAAIQRAALLGASLHASFRVLTHPMRPASTSSSNPDGRDGGKRGRERTSQLLQQQQQSDRVKARAASLSPTRSWRMMLRCASVYI